MSVLIFDLWNTLGTRPSFALALRKHFALPLFSFSKLYEQTLQTRQFLDLESFATYFLSVFSLPKTQENISQVIKLHHHSLQQAVPFKGMKELLEELSNRFTLVVLSNSSSFCAEVLKQWEFDQFFTKTFFSFQTGLLKPDPQAFLTVCTSLNVEPSLCLFIDDLQENVLAARVLGMQSIQFESVDTLRSFFHL